MKNLFLCLLVTLIATPALALTLAEKKQYAEWQGYFAEDGHAKEFKEKCGYDLPVTLNEDLVTPFMANNTSAPAYCDGVLEAMAYMCEDATSKEAIAGKIKSLSCGYKQGDTEGTFSLSNGALSFSSDVGAPNISEKAKKYLESNL